MSDVGITAGTTSTGTARVQNILNNSCGGAIVQAVSRQFPIATGRVRAQFRSCWISSGKSGTGAGFLLVLYFPLPILIPPIAPH
jgi:hypothetical protein